MNEKNLKSFKDMSREENSRIAKMGAKASVEAKRRKKLVKKALNYFSHFQHRIKTKKNFKKTE